MWKEERIYYNKMDVEISCVKRGVSRDHMNVKDVNMVISITSSNLYAPSYLLNRKMKRMNNWITAKSATTKHLLINLHGFNVVIHT